MQGVLPSEELPSFFEALEAMGMRPRKSIRIRRDLAPDSTWDPTAIREAGIPLGEPVPWYDRGFFFDLKQMSPHPSRHPWIAAGLGFIQEAGAMEVVPALEVEPDHLVLDLCSAPGAKASHIGEYLGTGGWLVANEPSRDRAKLLDAILARHGIGNSTVLNLEPRDLVRSFRELFDRILVDAPCSGESLFAKREERRKDVSDKEVERCALRQNAILESAHALCAPGGRIVYSTCAYSRSENEEVIETMRERHPDLRLLREQRRFPHRDGVPGGYFAVLEKAGAPSAAADRIATLRESIRGLGTRGLVRNGLKKWDGSIDGYAVVMDRKTTEASADSRMSRLFPGIRGEFFELGMEEAARFLGGERRAKVARGVFAIYRWGGEIFAAETDATLFYPRHRL